MSMTQFTNEDLKVMSTEYHLEDVGTIVDEPIVTLHCRRDDKSARSVEVEGFYPHFYTTIEGYEENEDTILNESAVRSVEIPEDLANKRRRLNDSVSFYEDMDWETLFDEPVVRIYTVRPDDTPTVRDFLQEHGYETFEPHIAKGDMGDGPMPDAVTERVARLLWQEFQIDIKKHDVEAIDPQSDEVAVL